MQSRATVSASRKKIPSIVHINEEDREVWKVEVAGLRRRRVSSRLALRVAVGFPFWVVPAEYTPPGWFILGPLDEK